VNEPSDVAKESASLVARDECNGIARWRSILFPIQKPINDSRYREPFEQDHHENTKSRSAEAAIRECLSATVARLSG
jgi:hypothetical protein